MTAAAVSTPTEEDPQAVIDVRGASVEDADEIAHVLRCNAVVPTLILQPPAIIARDIEDFVVVREPDGTPRGAVVGCAQLHWHRPRIAEVMAVAVKPSRHTQGLGQALVRACLERAMRRDPELVWLATTSPAFFEGLGFARISMWDVPLPVLLGKLRLVLAQAPRRWPGALLGRPVFMRWRGAWVAPCAVSSP
jgi:N-acetylglutamate synthase-like GNAT family acetyltransferase